LPLWVDDGGGAVKPLHECTDDELQTRARSGSETAWDALVYDRDVDPLTLSARPMGPRRNGSPRCESGSVASGGTRTYCTCDACW
jgi:hypothetical protein